MVRNTQIPCDDAEIQNPTRQASEMAVLYRKGISVVFVKCMSRFNMKCLQITSSYSNLTPIPELLVRNRDAI